MERRTCYINPQKEKESNVLKITKEKFNQYNKFTGTPEVQISKFNGTWEKKCRPQIGIHLHTQLAGCSEAAVVVAADSSLEEDGEPLEMVSLAG